MARISMSEQVANKIEEMILTDHLYKAGDKIPPEMELASQMDVSRTTIREAVKVLCSRNILEIKRGSGTFVCENPGKHMDPFGYRLLDDERMTNDIFEMSVELEPVLTGLAARKADDRSIVLIQKLHDELQNKIRRFHEGEYLVPSEFRKLDVEFHKAIMEACDNEIIIRSLPVFLENCTEWYNVWTNLNYKRVLSSFDKYHTLILDAIKEHDEEKARQYSHEHTQEIIGIYREGRK